MLRTTARPGDGAGARPAAKRVTLLHGSGGVGSTAVLKVLDRCDGLQGVGARFVDTTCPPGVSTQSFTELRPDHLPDSPDARLLQMIRDSGLTLASYLRYKPQTGRAGVARLPALGYLAAMVQLDELVAASERDIRSLTASVGGAGEVVTMTVASTCGGTGAPSSRVVGLAARLAHGHLAEHRWIHVAVDISVLPAEAITRRTRALQHRSLCELSALSHPDAQLRIPGRRAAVQRPGPDLVLLAAASPAAPRTLDEIADELSIVLRNIIVT